MRLPYVALVAVAVLAGSLQAIALVSPCQPVQAQADACVEAVGNADDGDVRHLQLLVAPANVLVEAAPLCAAVWQCLAAVHYNLGDVSSAEQAFRKVTELDPTSSHGWSNLGVALTHIGRLEAATGAFHNAVLLDPTSGVGNLMLGSTLLDRNLVSEGVEHLRNALASQVQWEPTVETQMRSCLAYGLTSMGDLEAAVAALGAGAVRIPELRIRQAASMTPVVPRSTEEYITWRRRMTATVQAVLADLRSGALPISGHVGPLDLGGDMAYMLTYQGHNDRNLRSAVVDMYGAAFPALQFTSPRLLQGTYTSPVAFPGNAARPPVLHRRVRVGFVSDFLYHHSVGKMMTRLVTSLPRSLFHVTVFRFLGHTDWVRTVVDDAADAVVALPETQSPDSIPRMHAAVDACDLDVLVFPEIGMHLQTYLLSFARMAPVQLVTHGNSITSGMRDTIDYFVSLDDAEGDGGATHYSEQLTRLAAHHSAFLAPLPRQAGYSRGWTRKPAQTAVAFVVATFGARRALRLLVADSPGLAEVAQQRPALPSTCPSGAVYLCPQSLFKIHPDFDDVLIDILRRDPCGHVVLVEGTDTAWDKAVVERIVRRAATAFTGSPTQLSPDGAAVVQRLLMVPQLPHQEFLALLASGDVIVDTHPFGGCTTSYEALAVGTPVVTWPGEALRGRFTAAMLRRAGMLSNIVASAQQLVDVSIQVATRTLGASAKEQRKQRDDVASKALQLLESGQEAVQEWSRLLLRAVASAAIV